MKHRTSLIAWLALATGAIVLLRHLAARPREDSSSSDFDEDAFIESALALGLRERRLANGILEHAGDESLRTLARMILAQHQAEDGVWAGLDTSAAGEDASIRLPGFKPAEYEHHAALAMQSMLDEAWPLFDLASQRCTRDDLRDWALRMLAWLEESEQVLAPILERVAPDVPGRPQPSPEGVY
ncbi:hypothetical protein [Pseudoxanthomonas sp. z9]|uniref:hypothetical protein n=1 Tax=Pseudoxanthomonas sp. z9 TaxID=2584942 RepID=UPI0011429ADF|nr:hypothetical protein [Pseudoxanthomonas sp. z9]